MSAAENGPAPAFSSNAERLSIPEWCGLLVGVVLLGVAAGPVWTRLEVFDPPAEYRIPYAFSEDYWLFDRFCRIAQEQDKSFVLGDSFVWGQYVGEGETLSSFLNQLAGSDRYVNAGLDGTHPLALEGLIRHHCSSLEDHEVLLHLNLLWVSSPQADLSSERGTRVNHPRLVPQFIPSIPGYRASVSDKLGIAVARHLPLLNWSRHLRSAYFSNSDLPRWTLENPYRNPIRQIVPALPDSADDPRHDPRPWFASGVQLQSPPWVDLQSSLQWKAFQRLVGFLRTRGNRVFVLVGPLNEHMLDPTNAEEYGRRLVEAQSWLLEQGVPHYAPPVLPSELYADLSHPLAEGYDSLARDLWTRLPR